MAVVPSGKLGTSSGRGLSQEEGEEVSSFAKSKGLRTMGKAVE